MTISPFADCRSGILASIARAAMEYVGQSYLPAGFGVMAAASLMKQDCLLMLAGVGALLTHCRQRSRALAAH